MAGNGPGGTEIPAGTPVVVTAVDGLRLTVRPATAPEIEATREAAPDRRTVVPVTGT